MPVSSEIGMLTVLQSYTIYIYTKVCGHPFKLVDSVISVEAVDTEQWKQWNGAVEAVETGSLE